MPISPRVAASFALVAALGACTPAGQSADEQTVSATEPANPAPAFYSYDGWIGDWAGGDNQKLTISPAGDGNYMIDMQADLDAHVVYTAVPSAEGLEFTRGGQKLVLREGTGDETGVEGMDGKQDCLILGSREGFCRD